MTNGVTVLSYSRVPGEHTVPTNSPSDGVYLIKVNKLTEALSLEKEGCCLSQEELSLSCLFQNINNKEQNAAKQINTSGCFISNMFYIYYATLGLGGLV